MRAERSRLLRALGYLSEQDETNRVMVEVIDLLEYGALGGRGAALAHPMHAPKKGEFFHCLTIVTLEFWTFGLKGLDRLSALTFRYGFA